MKQSRIISLQADKTVDASCKTIGLLDVIQELNILEILGSFEVKDKTVVTLCIIIFEQLSKDGLDKEPNKFIFQSYNLSFIIRGEKITLRHLSVRKQHLIINSIKKHTHQLILELMMKAQSLKLIT